MSEKAQRILVVEDDLAILTGLSMNLRIEGYEVLQAQDGRTGLAKALDEAPDLLVLDIMLPELNGYELLKELRRRGRDTPVVMLSAKGQETDKILGLNLGADDYVVKPFGLQELLARIKAVLRRRYPPTGTPPVTFGDVEVELVSRTVARAGKPVELTAQEFKLLAHFLAQPGAHVHARGAAVGRVGLRLRGQRPHGGQLRAPAAAQVRAGSRGARATSSPSAAWATGSIAEDFPAVSRSRAARGAAPAHAPHADLPRVLQVERLAVEAAVALVQRQPARRTGPRPAPRARSGAASAGGWARCLRAACARAGAGRTADGAAPAASRGASSSSSSRMMASRGGFSTSKMNVPPGARWWRTVATKASRSSSVCHQPQRMLRREHQREALRQPQRPHVRRR